MSRLPLSSALVALVVASSTFADPPDPTNVAWTLYNPPVLVQGGSGIQTAIAGFQGEFTGTFAFPWGSGYGCGVKTTITIGTEKTLSAGFTAQGVSASTSVAYKFEQAYEHTSPNCQTCQLWVKYNNATLKRYYVAHTNWLLSGYDGWRANFYHKLSQVVPTCEVTNAACTAAGQICPPPGGIAGGDDGEGPIASEPYSTLVIDLQESFLNPTGWPEGHPAYGPHGKLDLLTPWHRCELARELEASTGFVNDPAFGSPNMIRFLIVIDDDGQTHQFDLEQGSPPFVCSCPADFNGDGVVDGVDLGALLATWGVADSVGDLDGDGVVGAGDLGAMLAAWGACG